MQMTHTLFAFINLLLLVTICQLLPNKTSSFPISTKSKLNSKPSALRSTPDDEERKTIGRLERLKSREAKLSRLVASIRKEKIEILRSCPLTIGIVGFGRFGQFIARTFLKYHRVVVTSRSDYSDLAQEMGAVYVPMSEPEAFLAHDLDVIVIAVSIMSFEDTIRTLAPHIETMLAKKPEGLGPLMVDVLSVKDYPRKIFLDSLPLKCDILCTHPMFGPDSGKKSWFNLNFVYERTRIDGIVQDRDVYQLTESENGLNPSAGDFNGGHSNSYVLGMDRIERFLSIWEEEGCRMVPMSCQTHDEYAANSQFITHLMGRILGSQGLQKTPIDTIGFESVLKLIGSTTADSFDLFYGLYKYNKNSMFTIMKLKSAMDGVVQTLKLMEEKDKALKADVVHGKKD